jgi:hypothetical protein
MTRKETEDVSKPRKDEHAVRISTRHTAIARKLAESQNKAFAEILSDAVERGLNELIEADNRANIWERTSQKREIITVLDAIPQEKLAEAIELLKQLKN